MRGKPSYHGGPEVKTPTPETSARRRGLTPTYPPNTSHAKTIMRNGQPIMGKRLAKIIHDVMASRAKLDAQAELSPKFRSLLQREERERLGSGGTLTNLNRTHPKDPDAGDGDRVDERA